jgi:hypothetical protein
MPETDNVLPFTVNQQSLEIVEKRAKLESSAVMQLATELVVKDNETYLAAGELRREINVKDGVLEREFKAVKQSIDASKRTVLSFESKARTPFAEALKVVDGKLKLYRDEQEEKRRAEEERLRAAAKKLEDDRRLREAEEAIKGGATEEEALQVLEQPSTMPAPSLPALVPKLPGTAFVERWRAEITNLHDLVLHVGMHAELLNLIEPNMPALNQMARAQKGALSIPGVRAVAEESVSGKRN